jgi:hypothetical protein
VHVYIVFISSVWGPRLVHNSACQRVPIQAIYDNVPPKLQIKVESNALSVMKSIAFDSFLAFFHRKTHFSQAVKRNTRSSSDGDGCVC